MATPATSNITLVAGDGFAKRHTFYRVVDGVRESRDISDSIFSAQIRASRYSSLILATFHILRRADHEDPDAIPANTLFIALTSTQTRALPKFSWWDLQEQIEEDGNPVTKFEGRVHVLRDISA